MSTISELSELVAGLRTLLTTERDAYGLAHDLGHALPSLDDASLRELRNELVQVAPEDPVVKAVAATLVELVDGYRLGRSQTVTLSLREGINRAVLSALEQRASTTSELAKLLSRDEPQISRAIARLRELDLIDPPRRDPADRRRIEHRLSLAAKQALGRLDQGARAAPIWPLSASESLEERTIRVDEDPPAVRGPAKLTWAPENNFGPPVAPPSSAEVKPNGTPRPSRSPRYIPINELRKHTGPNPTLRAASRAASLNALVKKTSIG